MPTDSGDDISRHATTSRQAGTLRRAGCVLALALCALMLTGEAPEAQAAVSVDPVVVQVSGVTEDDGRTNVALRDLGLRGSDHSYDVVAGAPHIPTFTLREIAVTVVLLVIGGLVALLGIGARGDGGGYDQL